MPVLESMADWDGVFTKEDAIHLYDKVGDDVNKTFPEFMDKTFNTGIKRGSIIAAGREIVAVTALFIKKKKYAALVIDLEGTRKDVKGKAGDLKIMGLDLKRSDTPQYMQEFLETVLLDALTDVSQGEIFDKIKDFRNDFRFKDGWDKGTPKKVNGITNVTTQLGMVSDLEGVDIKNINAGEKLKVKTAGHVTASINWNKMLEINSDLHTMRISDGSKVIVCKLKPNPNGMDSIAYPIDEPHLPDWFKQMPFDHPAMEKTIIDFKLKNLFGVLDWDLSLADDRVDNEFFTW